MLTRPNVGAHSRAPLHTRHFSAENRFLWRHRRQQCTGLPAANPYPRTLTTAPIVVNMTKTTDSQLQLLQLLFCCFRRIFRFIRILSLHLTDDWRLKTIDYPVRFSALSSLRRMLEHPTLTSESDESEEFCESSASRSLKSALKTMLCICGFCSFCD